MSNPYDLLGSARELWNIVGYEIRKWISRRRHQSSAPIIISQSSGGHREQVKQPINGVDHLAPLFAHNNHQTTIQTISSITNVSAHCLGNDFAEILKFLIFPRITARRKYHSPGTVSCQDFAPTPIQIQTKPYFTPGKCYCTLTFILSVLQKVDDLDFW